MSTPRAGYTLPVFACASAIAALQRLHDMQAAPEHVAVNLLEPAETVEIPIEQLAPLPDGSVLAVTRSDPGDNLDLTRHTPVWALVAIAAPSQSEPIQLDGGEGVGQTLAGEAAIYAYAQRLLQANLAPLLSGQKIRVTIILPAGRALALRTSNAAFGIVDGLSLLGTTGIAQPLSAPGQLEHFREILQKKAKTYEALVFCLGENGLDLAVQMGINPDQRIKTANWLGPLLAEAALQGIGSILLFGYHGKLIKLAGGIFHTHHHVADARQEILAAICAGEGLPTERVQQILHSPTAEAGLSALRGWDDADGSDWVSQVYGAIASRIDQRSQQYIYTHSERTVTVGSILFDRTRRIIIKSANGDTLLPWVC
ncbi:MAG: cobalt-precorrin-5B (C(1))-methyltransferase [Leptolyngbya sp. SIO4C1]|nr:cobalt-precorrin-5B (C(1))-methyltransferase [Leptolyngbya sp. SIO4C1]